MLCRNIEPYKIVSVILIFILCIMVFCSCGSESIIIYEYDDSTYLTGNTPFENVACTVLPLNSELKNSKVTYYEYIKHSNEESMRISVVYSDYEFQVAKQKVENQYEQQHNDAFEYTSFYFDGILYNAYMFYVDTGRYVMAYHICNDLNTISYVLAQNHDFEYYPVLQAFEVTYGEYRITPIS